MNRRRYYDIFSLFYDRIIAFHSRDSRAILRKFLIERSGVERGGRLLDVCTGTGAIPLAAAELFGDQIQVIGLDFSMGMLKKAYTRIKSGSAPATALHTVDLVQSDASWLPFQDSSFQAVTCSHAMYELKPEVRERVLAETRRVLATGGLFAMMEHCEPEKPFIRFLYRLRLSGLGRGGNLDFARDEVPYLSRYFKDVRMELAPGGKSKVISGVKA